jgi:hypothetical protein
MHTGYEQRPNCTVQWNPSSPTKKQREKKDKKRKPTPLSAMVYSILGEMQGLLATQSHMSTGAVIQHHLGSIEPEPN